MNPPATPSCLICGQPLSGKQTAFCSRPCKNQNTNYHHQSYGKQLERGRTRKIKLLMKLGGQCVVCGYARNLAALEFHHVNPRSKLFQLDMRSLANRNWDEIEIEAKKCIVLCSNCHAEHHNPGSSIDGV
jgi:5-methylcytosine-specific restriction endonuclease McrA